MLQWWNGRWLVGRSGRSGGSLPSLMDVGSQAQAERDESWRHVWPEGKGSEIMYYFFGFVFF